MKALRTRVCESGYYAEQVRKFVTLFRSPPGRETYDVGIADTTPTFSLAV